MWTVQIDKHFVKLCRDTLIVYEHAQQLVNNSSNNFVVIYVFHDVHKVIRDPNSFHVD